jgi:hypothetical protein
MMMQALQLLVGAGAAVGFFVLLSRPQWVVLLIIMMFPMEQLVQAYIPAFGANRAMFNYIVAALGAVGVVSRFAKREPITLGYFNIATICIAFIYVLWFVGVYWTPATLVAKEQVVASYPYIILMLVFLPLLLVDVFEFRRVLMGLMIGGTVLAVLIMLHPNSTFYSGRLSLDLGMNAGPARVSNPLALGELGGMIAIIAVLFQSQRGGTWYTVIRVTAFIAGMGLAIGSGSRGQVLGACVAAVMFFPVARRMANPKQFLVSLIVFAVVVAGLLLVFKLFIGQQNQQRWDPFAMVRDTTMRLNMVEELLGAYFAHPSQWLFGLGTNAYATISSDRHTIYVHNIAAEVLGEHGIVGFSLFLIVSILTVIYGRNLWKMYRDDPSMRAVVAVLLAICANGLFLALKQGSMGYPAPFFWWLILAKLYHHERLLAPSHAAEAVAEPGHDADDESLPADVDPDSEGQFALGY